MKKDTWVWQISSHGEGYCVILQQTSILDELLSWVGGTLIRYGLTYRPGNRLIRHLDRRVEGVMRLPITEEQARELGWEWGDE